MEWEILLTSEVEAFLDDLYESDMASHRPVNQAILVLERNAGGGAPAGGLDHRVTDREHEGAAAAVGCAVRCGSCSCSIRGGRRSCWWRGISRGSGTGGIAWRSPGAEQLYDDYLAEREKEMDK